jgi:hypothetical protein
VNESDQALEPLPEHPPSPINSFEDFQALMQFGPQSHLQTSHGQSYDGQSHRNDASDCSHGHAAVSSPVKDHQAIQALGKLEDPRVQETLAHYHGKRTSKVARELTQKVFDQPSVGRYDRNLGWIISATTSRAAGAEEVGLVAEFDMPVIRGDSRPLSQDVKWWVPGANNGTIMTKKELGLVVTNDKHCKTMKTFTTKSGTNKDHLRMSGQLRHYVQIIRSPKEENIRRETGTYGELRIVTSDVEGIDWDIDGPRFMSISKTYEHPHGAPYRIVGYLKDSSDTALLNDMHRAAATSAVRQTNAAFDQRRRNLDWFDKYRIVRQPAIDRSTVIEQVRSILLILSTAYQLTYSRLAHFRSQTTTSPSYMLAAPFQKRHVMQVVCPRRI